MLFNGKNSFDPKKFSTKRPDDAPEKKEALKILDEHIAKMAELQDRLYAHDKDALLIIFQAMDAGGKDGMIKHVMKGVNPQGTQVFSFKQPSSEELDHDYLWRYIKCLPRRGNIGIFNRSYYEDVLVAKVHELPEKQNKLPARCLNDPELWEKRYRQIRDFERYLYENGVVVLKFFLNISKDEQKKRFLKRIERKEKNWKFSSADLAERKHWDDYQKAFEKAINSTATEFAPWFVIPADSKWYARLAVSQIITQVLERCEPQYPSLDEEELKKLKSAKDILLNE
ncbi:MAG: polyphosphate kinase 2 family protein [Firmicutes bacterium]|nr:polyphosphate kinase 2 family protein [Bacillota bacterium]